MAKSQTQYDKVEDVVAQFGYEQKAVRELCKRDICCSHAEARKMIKYVKINNGEKVVKEFSCHTDE